MRGLLVGDVFSNAARAVPDRLAAAMGDETLTFGELDSAANRMARALASAGIACGDRVLCWTGTSLAVLPLFAALAKLGAVYAPMAANLHVTEADEATRLIQPSLCVVDEEHRGVGAEVAAAVGVPLLTLGELTARATSLAADAMASDVRETDPHVIFFTSGSTGRSKGVVLSHRVNMLRTYPGAQLEPRGAMVCTFPLFHMAGWTISLGQWQARGAIVYLDQPDGASVCDAVRAHDAWRLYAVPAVWERVLGQLDGGTLPSLRFADTGTSATPPELLRAIQAAAPNAAVRVFYGSTEAGNVASLEAADVAARPGSCGQPSVLAEVRLTADGELCVRGPMVFEGYFTDPGATAEAFDDEWYRTGDLAQVDDAGYVYIVGRVREVIRTGGETVAPVEVESVLARAPGVREVAVVGVPDPTWGEVVCAVVVPSDDAAPPTLDALRAHCEGLLASFKHPRRLHVTDALPRTPATGQVQRTRLLDQIGRSDRGN